MEVQIARLISFKFPAEEFIFLSKALISAFSKYVPLREDQC